MNIEDILERINDILDFHDSEDVAPNGKDLLEELESLKSDIICSNGL